MDFSDVNYKGKPFDGKADFCQWRSQIERVLLVPGFYDVMQGIERKPESMSIYKWGALEGEACSVIRMSLTPTLRFQLWKETSDMALLENLEKDYKANSVWHGCILRRKLHHLKMKEGFDEEDKVLLLFDSFPQSFEPLKLVRPISRDKLKVDHVRERIIATDTLIRPARTSLISTQNK